MDLQQGKDTQGIQSHVTTQAIEATSHSQDFRALIPLKPSIQPEAQNKTYIQLATAAFKRDQEGFDAIARASALSPPSAREGQTILNTGRGMVLANQSTEHFNTAGRKFGEGDTEAGTAAIKAGHETNIDREKEGYIPSANKATAEAIVVTYNSLQGNSTAQQDMLRAAAQIAPSAAIEAVLMLEMTDRNSQLTATMMAANLAFATAFMRMFDDYIDQQTDERAKKEYMKKRKELEEQGVGTKIDETKAGKIESIIHAEVPVRMNIPTTLYIHNHLSELVPRVNLEFRAKEVM